MQIIGDVIAGVSDDVIKIRRDVDDVKGPLILGGPGIAVLYDVELDVDEISYPYREMVGSECDKTMGGGIVLP